MSTGGQEPADDKGSLKKATPEDKSNKNDGKGQKTGTTKSTGGQEPADDKGS